MTAGREKGTAAQVDPAFPEMDASSAVYPTVRIVGDQVHIAYHLPDCRDSAVVTFSGVSSWNYGGPNDEGLAAHPLWGRGLTFYSFHEVLPPSASARRWVGTFHDGTFDVVASAATVRSHCVAGSHPSAALDSVLGEGINRILDDDAA